MRKNMKVKDNFNRPVYEFMQRKVKDIFYDIVGDDDDFGIENAVYPLELTVNDGNSYDGYMSFCDGFIEQAFVFNPATKEEWTIGNEKADRVLDEIYDRYYEEDEEDDYDFGHLDCFLGVEFVAWKQKDNIVEFEVRSFINKDYEYGRSKYNTYIYEKNIYADINDLEASLGEIENCIYEAFDSLKIM